ncbi:uncharacterized protein F4822DRAFT_234552 [Hypoxylon trugodes]|uniref:uncharacterized protein n=1 Tax=Hypoxylon trugodes TaxID=326681 RepID=UPI00218D4E5E|nr:uncharacterized protein F4822DRAFT_234552 [Hypoxylon trugodes]KAI1390375.1 hypothetical protein F4822DRAFT_234552 [Hypoxylon trugodes]
MTISSAVMEAAPSLGTSLKQAIIIDDNVSVLANGPGQSGSIDGPVYKGECCGSFEFSDKPYYGLTPRSIYESLNQNINIIDGLPPCPAPVQPTQCTQLTDADELGKGSKRKRDESSSPGGFKAPYGPSNELPMFKTDQESTDSADSSDDEPLKNHTTTSILSPKSQYEYRTWTSPSGQTSSTSGALIPKDYKLHDDPKFP